MLKGSSALDDIKRYSCVKIVITKVEFASMLGLRSKSAFLDYIFRLVDKNKTGYITFQDFLLFFFTFHKGTLTLSYW